MKADLAVLMDVDSEHHANVIIIDVPESLPTKQQGSPMPNSNEEADKVVLVDLDSEHFDSIIVIDVPESFPKKRQDSRMTGKENKCPFRNVTCIYDDESTDNNNSLCGTNKNGSFYNDVSGIKKSSPALNNFSSSAASQECQFGEENVVPVRLSKCKHAYARNASTRSHYGLGNISDRELSDGEHPDSEVMDYYSTGKIKRQQEEAFFRRNGNIGQSSIRDHDSTSKVFNDNHHQNVRTESKDGQQGKTSFSSNTDETRNENEVLPPFIKEDEYSGHKMSYSEDYPPFNYAEKEYCKQNKPDNSRCQNEERLNPAAPSDSPSHAQGTDGKDNLISMKSSFLHSMIPKEQVNGSVGSVDRVGPVAGDDIDRSDHQASRKPVSETSSFCNGVLNAEQSRQRSSSVKAVENVIPSGITTMQDEVDEQQHIQNGSNLPGAENCLISEREKLKETDDYKRALEEEWASRQQALKIQAKEAQHLRQLRKRKRAEIIRLEDMEKRQKQRLEEIRESEKKDVENQKLKEAMRTKVRNDLKKLEMTSRNMASLLHSLGIHVDSWPHPSPHEVQAAYKRALLAFHPDRASKSDICQQVEAEEKFKLINRLKAEEEWRIQELIKRNQAEEAQRMKQQQLNKRKKDERKHAHDLKNRQQQRVEETHETRKKAEEAQRMQQQQQQHLNKRKKDERQHAHDLKNRRTAARGGNS